MLTILNEIFQYFSIDTQLLNDIDNELKKNKYKMIIESKFKRFDKQRKVQLNLSLEIYYFTYWANILENKKEHRIEIFKSLPINLAGRLFRTMKLVENILLVGSKDFPVFEIDILTNEVKIFKNNDSYINQHVQDILNIISYSKSINE